MTFKQGVRGHFANSTGMLAVLTPMWATIETFGYDAARHFVQGNVQAQRVFEYMHWNPDNLYMTEWQSMTSRALGIVTFYGGGGFVTQWHETVLAKSL
ncbi:MAG: hypothetical protein ABIA93_06785 [Candidatus Woesearchaeota archaeon]